jgi:hypothetical protein
MGTLNLRTLSAIPRTSGKCQMEPRYLEMLMLVAGENTTVSTPTVKGGMSERLYDTVRWTVAGARQEHDRRPDTRHRWRIQYLRCRLCAKKKDMVW